LDAGIANVKARDAGVSENTKIINHFVQEGNPLPFEDNTFDVAYASRVLCVVEDHLYVLNEMIRVVKPGGLVVTTCHDSSSFSSNLFTSKEEALIKSSLMSKHPDKASFDFSKNSLKDFLEFGL